MEEIPPTAATVLRLNLALLDQAEAAIRALSDHYRTPPSPDQSPVGAHVRHVIDHYSSFFLGIESGKVDYYTRERDPRLEADPDAAVEALRTVKERLSRSSDLLGRPLAVDTGGPEHEGGEARWAPSSVQREMAFVLSHTLHHMAIIRMAAHQLGVELHGDLGVAHSTLAHKGDAASSSYPQG